MNNWILYCAIDIYGIMGLDSFDLEAKWKQQKIHSEQVSVGGLRLFGAFTILTLTVSPFRGFMMGFNVCSVVFLLIYFGESPLGKVSTPKTSNSSDGVRVFERGNGETKQAPGRKQLQGLQRGGGGANSLQNLRWYFQPL